MNQKPIKRYEPVNYAAPMSSNGVHASLELGPKLNKMYCRRCEQLVEGSSRCPHCQKREGGS